MSHPSIAFIHTLECINTGNTLYEKFHLSYNCRRCKVRLCLNFERYIHLLQRGLSRGFHTSIEADLSGNAFLWTEGGINPL